MSETDENNSAQTGIAPEVDVDKLAEALLFDDAIVDPADEPDAEPVGTEPVARDDEGQEDADEGGEGDPDGKDQ